MAKRCGFTHIAIHLIWKAFSLHLDRAEVCQLSTDSFFIEKVRDVVASA